MLSLNLLPNNIKNENRLSHVYRFVISFNIVIVFFVTLIAVFLFLSMIIINIYNDKDISQGVLLNEVKKTESASENGATQFGVISKIQADFVPWSFLINELSKNIKNDISLNGLSIDKSKNAIVLTGQAGMRDSLLDMKKYLEDSPYFSNIIFPVKNILEKENIVFEIKANINIESVSKDSFSQTP